MGLGARSPGALCAALSLLLVSCGEGRESPDGDVDVAEVLGDLFDLFDLFDETEVPDLETSDQDQVEDHSDEGGDGDLSMLNRPPVIEILAPVDGAVFAFGERVSLSAIVSDDFDPPTALGVAWSSPIQGVIFVGSPDGDGQVEVVAEDLVIGRHRLEVTAVDSEGAEASAAVDIAVSAEDGAPVLRIVPAAPLTRDELTAEVVDPMLEAGVGGLEVEWAWFRGPEPMGSGATIAADATTKGETWRVLGVVKNGVEVTPPGVAQVTIGNTAPRCVGALGFDVDSQAKALTCRCDGRVDEDEADPVADRCAWTVAGSPFETEGACRLEWEGMAAGTRIGCELTPFDGDDEGGAVQTSSATEFVVPDAMGNTPPTTPGVALAPRFGNATDRFVCEVVSPSQDAQGDAVSYVVSWSVNGHWNTVGAASVVPASELVGGDGARAHDGDVIACRVVASDGVLQSAAGTSNEVRLGTVGVSVGELGDVVLDEVLGDGCFRDGEVALPSCAEDLFCSVAVTACFDENGALEGAPVVSAVVELPGLGTVVMEGEAGAQGGEGWCITGHPADLGPPVVPLPLSGLTLTACSGPDGVTSSLSGRVTLDGEVHPFVDAPFESVLVGQGADGFVLKIEIPLPAFRIGGTRFGGAISIATGERSVGFEGYAELEGVGADGRVALEGQWQAAGGALVSGTLSAGLGLSVAGLSFAGEAALSLDGGVWRLELEDGAMTLPGGHELSLSGAIEVVAGRLVEAELDAGAGVSFAGVEFSGDALVRWSSAERRFSLELAGGMLGPEGPSFDLSGSVVLEDGVVVAGALTAGADLAVGGVQFAGDAVVSWEDDTMFVGLAAGVVGLPGGADLSLAGELTLIDGALADASFVGSGSASVEGVRFGGEVSASWSGGARWSLGLSDGRLSLPGGDELTLSGSLTVVGGRVVSGSFAAGADLSFAGIAFSGAASASYRVERDDLGGVVSERLALGLSGGRLNVAGSGELTLSGEVEIEDGAVASAVFEAGTDLAIGDVRFAGAARVEYTAPGRFELVLSGGQVEVAGATLVVGGRIAIEGGVLTCGELDADAAVSAQLGGVSFGLGLRYAGAGTCVWRDGTTIVSEAPRFVVSLREGRLSVGPATLTLAGNATLVDGALACAELEATGGAAVAVGGVSFAAGARYAAAGQRCAWSESDGVGELELTLRRGVVQVAGQSVSLSGAAVLGGGAIVSAAFAGEAALEVPGAGAAFGVEGSYVAATNAFSLRLAGGRVAMAGATFTFEGQGEVVGGQVGCLIFETSAASPAVAVIGESALEVGARMAARDSSAHGWRGRRRCPSSR